MSLAPGIRLGPYEILSALGSGGMGQVYRARDTRLDRVVAVKILPPDLIAAPDGRARLAREARAAAALNHPHICALHDFCSDSGIDYLVMEYLEGETLTERLMAGPLSLAEVLRYSIDIADALEHAHRRGFVHRDLKPGNVMLTKSGAVLLDFGLAKPFGAAAFAGRASPSPTGAQTQDWTIEGTIRGTLAYMPPEQLEGGDVDARSDLFAFGAVLYEMATGRKAFDAPSHAGVIAAILSTEPPPIRELRPLAAALDRTVQKCLAKDPDERWQSAHDLKTALQWIAEPDWNEARVSTTPRPAWPRERIAWTIIGVLALGSVLAFAIGWVARQGNPARDDAEPVVFSVGPPENATLFAGGAVMALSPDGRHVALVATPSGGKSLLWIRSLDADTARPLLGTIGASQPFWSPDSRFVAFFAGKQLKKVDVTSGEVQTLCDDATGTAGTWSRGGVILFKSDVTGRIERVSADGGTTSPVAAVDSSRGEFWLNWPQFLPDGRRFLYLVRSTQPEYNGVFLASLDGPERTRVLSDESQAIYASPGYLLFHRDATLFAQRFDPASLEKTGAALPLVENVQVNMGTRRGVFSVSDTGILTYRAAEDSVLSWFDRDGNVLSTVASGSEYRDPAISPDGRTVAVATQDRRVENYDLWLIDADGARRFTFDPGRDLAPVWSPDGARIAFASRRGEKEDIYVKSSTGVAAEELLYSATGPARPFDWSRDERFVVFGQLGVQGHIDLWALPFKPGHRPFGVLETPAIEGQAQLSPDGRWLAYDSNEEGAWQVFVRPFPNTGAQTWKISDRGGLEPKWRRDGKELFYLGADRRLMSVTVRTAPTFEHDTPRALFETGAAGSRLGTVAGRNQYDVAPDGKRFLINVPGRESSKPITVVLNWPAILTR